MTDYLFAKWNITTGYGQPDNCPIAKLTYPYYEHFSKYDQLFKNKLAPVFHQQCLNFPTEWLSPRVIEVSPYSDLFDPAFNSHSIRQVFEIIEQTQQHVYLVTTKFPERAARASDIIGWPANLWCGVSIQNNTHLESRLKTANNIPALIRFVEFQPITEAIKPFKEFASSSLDFLTVRPPISDPAHLTALSSTELGLPIAVKNKNNDYTSASFEVFLYTLTIDNNKAPQTWTINPL